MREIYRPQIYYSTDRPNGGRSLQEEPIRETKEVRLERLAALVRENHSDEVTTNLEAHTEIMQAGEGAYEAACADAREDAPTSGRALVDRRIAAGVLPEKAASIMRHPSIRFGVVRPHYAGSSAVPGRVPTGCGGNQAFGEMQQAENLPHDPLFEYVGTRVAHTDPIIHGLKLARRIARLSTEEKPVLLMPYDHETGKSRVVGMLQRRGNSMIDMTRVDFHVPLDGQYDPAQVYANGVPNMDRGELPDFIQDYLDAYDARLQEHPVNFADQQTQDPGWLMFTDELRDSNLWLPRTYHKPNVGFRLGLYATNGDILGDDQDVALAQARYVLRQAISNALIPGTPFHSTRKVGIFTREYEQSKRLAGKFVLSARQLAAQDQAPMWFSLPNTQIVIGEVNNGIIQRIGDIDVQMRKGEIVGYEETELEFKKKVA